MILLGIDVGLRKIGVARAEIHIAEPLLVIRESKIDELVHKIAQLVEKEGADSVVVGMPEGRLAPFAQKVGKALEDKGVQVVFWDETLTTQDAQKMAIEAGITKKKRKDLEDAFAATVMLQSFIDSKM